MAGVTVSGVVYTGRKKPWRAQIKICNKLKYLGTFATLEEGMAAYEAAAKEREEINKKKAGK